MQKNVLIALLVLAVVILLLPAQETKPQRWYWHNHVDDQTGEIEQTFLINMNNGNVRYVTVDENGAPVLEKMEHVDYQ